MNKYYLYNKEISRHPVWFQVARPNNFFQRYPIFVYIISTCAWKPKVPGSSPAATYVQRCELSAAIAREMPSPFSCSPVVREWL